MLWSQKKKKVVCFFFKKLFVSVMCPRNETWENWDLYLAELLLLQRPSGEPFWKFLLLCFANLRQLIFKGGLVWLVLGDSLACLLWWDVVPSLWLMFRADHSTRGAQGEEGVVFKFVPWPYNHWSIYMHSVIALLPGGWEDFSSLSSWSVSGLEVFPLWLYAHVGLLL